MLNELKQIYNIYPRRFFTTKSWTINSFDEFIATLQSNIGLSRCSSSIYNYPEVDADIVVDRIAFDLDEKDCHAQALKLHNYLLDENIKHFIVFSGAHFHIYAKINYVPIFKKDYIKSLSLKLEKKLGIINDQSVRGNLHHNLGIPFSFNFKRQRYVRPLTSQELELSYDEICELAKKNTDTIKFYGENGFYGEDLDKPSYENMGEQDHTEVISFNNKLLDMLPQDAKEMMQNPELKHPQRLKLITLMMEFGFSKTQTKQALKICLSPRKYIHAIYEENQVENVYATQYDILHG